MGAVIPGVRKIAVLRANALGDFIFSLPALDALRATYPLAEIVLLGRPWHAEYLGNRPGPVDRVEVVPASTGVREEALQEEDPAQLEAFFAAMAEEAFDLAVQVHGGGRYSNPFVRRLGARLSVGLRAPGAEALDRWVPYLYFQHEVVRQLEVVSLVGAQPAGLEPRITCTESDLDESLGVLPDAGRPLVVVHPGASDPRRRWAERNFVEVCNALAAGGAEVVLTGTTPEQALVEAVASATCGRAVNLCGRLSLGGLTGLLARARLVVSNDSGPLHLAAALETTTVGLYWCGNLINAGPLLRTRHRPLLSWRLDCPVCGKNCMSGACDHRESFLGDIAVADVLAQATCLLSK